MSKSLLYMMILIIVAFLVIDLVMVFTRKPPFEIVYYRANMEYDYSGNATFTTTAGLFFKKESEEKRYLQAYGEGSLDTFKKYFKDVSEKLGREIVPVTFNSTTTKRAGILEIREEAFLKNAATVKDGIVDTSMGDLMLNVAGDSEIRMSIPKDATILSVDPTPLKIVDGDIVWKPQANQGMVFPKVKFKREVR